MGGSILDLPTVQGMLPSEEAMSPWNNPALGTILPQSLAGSSPWKPCSHTSMDFREHSGGFYESTMLPEINVYKAHVHGCFNVFQIIVP